MMLMSRNFVALCHMTSGCHTHSFASAESAVPSMPNDPLYLCNSIGLVQWKM